MSKFIKYNDSYINLNTIQEIYIDYFTENGKDRFSVAITKIDGQKISLGVFNDRDDANKRLESLVKKIEVIDLDNTSTPATKLNINFN